ncbi:hypothetical protein GCM10018951_32280 [Pseudarthrobacter polychromogenes]
MFLLQLRHPRLHGVPGEAKLLGKCHNGLPRILGQGGEQAGIGAIQGLHNAQR